MIVHSLLLSDVALQTPPLDFTSMLVFSPPALPYIFHSLIKNFPPSLGNSEPANSLYLLSRFACLTCDHTWLEDLIMGATDAIEETFFVGLCLHRPRASLIGHSTGSS